ncbi:MAG: ammonia-forming cytochrome c nitrite reductase [Ignavibacterium sp.]
MSLKDLLIKKPWIGWIIFFVTLVIVFLIGLFGSSIVERRSESIQRFQIVREIPEWEPRNEVWGENFPREYQTYLETRDTSFASKYNGSVTIDMLQRDPKLVILWSGYSFALDYKQSRGHYYSITDIRNILRTGVPQPATCWTCKSTDVPRLLNKMGTENFYKQKWIDMGSEVVNSIGCQDCHEPNTMNLRITRPALIEAFQRQGKDIRKATLQDMRSLVCAQCHVEYYFGKEDHTYLTFPWDKGLNVDSTEVYYDNNNHVDFVNAISKAPILKAQHPDYELSQFGIHAQRGVSCADCHMPYKSEGGVKFTDHHVQSPLNNISRSCQVCHREDEETLRKNVYDRQDKIKELLEIAETSLVKAHLEAKAAWDNGATEEQMKPILQLIRHSQWRWDYVAASHGASFHAPLECARILGTSIQKSNEAQIKLAELLTKLNVKLPVPMPDISTKEKAQKFINLDMEKFRKEKTEFLKTVVVKWDEEAKKKQVKENY